MLERVIEDYMVDRMNQIGGKCIKLTSSSYRSLPDRMCIFPAGIIVWVEFKAPGRTPTNQQLVCHAELRDLHQQVVVIDSRAQCDALISWAIRRYYVIKVHEAKGLPSKTFHTGELPQRQVRRNARFVFGEPDSE